MSYEYLLSRCRRANVVRQITGSTLSPLPRSGTNRSPCNPSRQLHDTSTWIFAVLHVSVFRSILRLRIPTTQALTL